MVESHPDNALEDLRLDQPFGELKNHILSYDLDGMEKKVRIYLGVGVFVWMCMCMYLDFDC